MWLSSRVVIEMIGSLSIVPFENFSYKARVFKQIPVAKLVEFPAGGDDVRTSDRAVFKPCAVRIVSI